MRQFCAAVIVWAGYSLILAKGTAVAAEPAQHCGWRELEQGSGRVYECRPVRPRPASGHLTGWEHVGG